MCQLLSKNLCYLIHWLPKLRKPKTLCILLNKISISCLNIVQLYNLTIITIHYAPAPSLWPALRWHQLSLTDQNSCFPPIKTSAKLSSAEVIFLLLLKEQPHHEVFSKTYYFTFYPSTINYRIPCLRLSFWLKSFPLLAADVAWYVLGSGHHSPNGGGPRRRPLHGRGAHCRKASWIIGSKR